MTDKMAASMYVVVLLMTLTVVRGHLEDDDRVDVHVTYDEKTKGLPKEDYLAWASFIDAVNATGWGFLEVSTRYYGAGNYTDSMMAYAAGLLEGYLTRDLIALHWENTQSGYCKEPYSSYCLRLRDFLQTNLNWVRSSIKQYPYDSYWHQVEMFYTQLKGLTDGYNNDPQMPSLDIDPFGLYYNDFQHDPLSACNCTPPYSADLAIASRNDLNSETGHYVYDTLGFGMWGAVDFKMVATTDMQWLQFDAISGPTYQQQPPFQWSKVKDPDRYPHFGQPDLFKFKPYSFNGTLNPPFVPFWYKPNK